MNFKKLKELNKIRYLKIKFSNKNKELKNKVWKRREGTTVENHP